MIVNMASDSETRDKRMVQTVLNFRRSGTDPDAIYPAFVKTTGQADRFTSISRIGYYKEDRDEEMENAPSTQSSTISWSATTVSQDTQRQLERNESENESEKMDQRNELRRIAKETTKLLSQLLPGIRHARPDGYVYSPPNPPRLKQRYCPRYPGTAIRVFDADTLDTAIELANCAKYVKVQDKKPVCVLNMANAYHAGGGWKNGALAQEEALCYRSSLSFTLKLRYYPIPEFGAIYSPNVVVIRESMAMGHRLYPRDQAENFPIVSVVSVAAQYGPSVVTDRGDKQRYAKAQDRETMKEKMRVILRTAAYNGHRRLVLGALGCGAFANPRDDAADCWAEVFKEQEFSGGWWESVVFAVMGDSSDRAHRDGNFAVFHWKLHGMVI